MAKAFLVGVKGRTPSKPIPKRDAATAELLGRLPTGPYEFKKRGQTTWRSAAGKPALRTGMAAIRLSIGDAIWVRRPSAPSTIYALRAVDYVPPVEVPPYPYSSGTGGAHALWQDIHYEIAALRERTGNRYRFVCQGVCACRRISGSTTWSQHAWCNAIDGHVVDASGRFDKAATSAVVSKVKARGHAAETLWQVRNHYDHFHFTAKPKLYGTPPCAR